MAALAAVGLMGAAGLSAAPRLRLVSSTVGPVGIAQGASGGALQTQTVEAYNAADGALNLSLASSVTWITGTVGAPRACSTQAGQCIPLQLALNTASVPVGTATGIVTVSDPNAVDAPQTITVTVQIGSGVPNSLNMYVAPNGTRDVDFSTNAQVGTLAKTNDGGQWLSVALDGTGSFRFPFPYRVHFAPTANMGQGSYSGTITVSGSSFAADNKSIAATMQVTTQPIGQPSAGSVHVRLAQGAPAYTTSITLSNLGQGTLHLSNAQTSGAAWITATPYSLGGLIPDGVVLTINVKGLAVGSYTDAVAFTSNAAGYAGALGDTASLTVPVQLDVVAAGAPLVTFQGVQDNATFVPGDAVAPGDIVAVKGEQLSAKDGVSAGAPPLATLLSDTQVLFNGQPVPLFYTSYGQINCQIPADAPVGTSLVQVKRQDGQVSNVVSVTIASRAPRLLLGGVGQYGAITNLDYSRPMPLGSFPGVSTRPASVRDTLTLYAIGLGATSPYVATGQPAPVSEPLARLSTIPVVTFGGELGGATATALFAGLSPTYAGLYQVNVTIPANVPKGNVYVSLAFGDSTSNPVLIYIQ